MEITITEKTGHALAACPHCGWGNAAETDTATCCNPECGKTITLKWVYGEHSDVPCDGRCMGAVSTMCACSCGGRNHGRRWFNVVMEPQFLAAQTKRAKRHQATSVRRGQAEAKARQTSAEKVAALVQAHPTLAVLVTEPNAVPAQALQDSSFLSHLAHKLGRDGYLTDAQIVAAERAVLQWEDAQRRAAERETLRVEREQRDAELRSAGVTVPTGRITFTGTVVAVSEHHNTGRLPYGGDTYYRMTVVTEAGWKVNGNVPSAFGSWEWRASAPEQAREVERWMRDIRGSVVTMTATVSPGDRDPLFGFFSRPTKVAIHHASGV